MQDPRPESASRDLSGILSLTMRQTGIKTAPLAHTRCIAYMQLLSVDLGEMLAP